MNPRHAKSLASLAMGAACLGLFSPGTDAANAAVHIEGHVQAGGGAVAGSTVTLWAGSAGDPQELAQAKTDGDGHFEIGGDRRRQPARAYTS